MDEQETRPTLRLLSAIADDINKEHYLNAAYKAGELQIRLLRLLSRALKSPRPEPQRPFVDPDAVENREWRGDRE